MKKANMIQYLQIQHTIDLISLQTTEELVERGVMYTEADIAEKRSEWCKLGWIMSGMDIEDDYSLRKKSLEELLALRDALK